MTLNELREKYEAVNIEIIDLFGKLRKVTLPISYCNENVFKQGIGFDASNFGYAEVTSSDLVIVPDLERTWKDPFSQYPTRNLLGTIHHFPHDTNPEPFPFDPGILLRNALTLLRHHKIAYNYMILPELEFHIFEEFDFSLDAMSPYVDIRGNERSINQSKGYHIARPDDQTYEIRSEVVHRIEECGIPVKYHHHEVGLPGQQEIELDFLPAEKAADAILITKMMVHNITANQGLVSTFMPKPMYGSPGNGMHMHMFLSDEDNRSIFFSKEHPLHLSKTALNFMGGILKHLGAIMAFSNPSTNSYKRLIQGFEAPSSKSFAKSNRNAAIRIPAYTSLEETRFEYRTGDATCNPYLTITALLLAGIDGVLHSVDPYNDDQIEKDKGVPNDLFSAFHELKKDQEFLKP
ncbi:MAG: glutamine synthetase beta-grasp domain-containing protein, partial [Caldisericia bacterium]|nr:glutamine synthetase beta-grasp domain-containing protein [Caldisericia bacterium]